MEQFTLQNIQTIQYCHWMKKWSLDCAFNCLKSFVLTIFTARLEKRAKVMFSLCVSVHRGGPIPQCIAPPTPAPPPSHPGPPAGPRPPPKKKWTKFWTKNGQKKWTKFWTKKMDKVLDKKNGQKIGQTLWKLLEVGGAGGTSLAVTQEDCLVCYKSLNLIKLRSCR